MAANNSVTLTFAGETKNLEAAFGRVGGAAKTMGDKVEHEAGGGFKKAGETADEVDTKAMGFRDTLTGVQDTAGGLGQIMKGNLFDGFLQLGAGIGDLGSGFYNLLLPALEKTKIATLASAGASKVAAVGSEIWAGAQKLLNIAFLTSPITWIIIGIVALIAVIVLIATKTTWFQTAWKVAWGGIKKAAEAVGSWFKDTLYGKWIKGAWDGIKGAGEKVWDWMKALPGKLKTAFLNVSKFVSAPFRAGFNAVSTAWNNTVGRLHWTVPGWVPGIGGDSFSAPTLPKFHSGGTVPGIPGSEQLAILQAGERVSPVTSSGGDGQPVHVTVMLDREVLAASVAKFVKGRGGNVQFALGVGRG